MQREPNSDDGFGRIGEDHRLDRLDAQLDRLTAVERERTGQNRRGADANERLGNRVLADLIGGIAGGALMGWLVDRLFGTAPWGFLILLALGIVVAFRNIFRLASRGTTNSGPAATAVPHDDDGAD